MIGENSMTKDLNECTAIYQTYLVQGDIQRAYVSLMKYVAELKVNFPSEYKTGYISPGYLDFTYFPFFNDFLRSRKLRFGIVLNHEKMQVECWLMGQNASVQSDYWEILKETSWNEGCTQMPRYSVLEICLTEKIDFNQKELMTETIINCAVKEARKIQDFIEEIER